MVNLAVETVLAERITSAPYTKTVPFEGEFINAPHARLARAPLQDGSVKIAHEIRGSLRREDAAKIYELAYFAGGPTADIGTNWGLSAFIAAQALREAGTPYNVSTVDLDPKMKARADASFLKLGAKNIATFTAEASQWMDRQIAGGRRFAFAFVDHAHTYKPVRDVCERLHLFLMPGAYVAFHDFLDRRSYDGGNDEFAVPQAARDGLDECFAYRGSAGCTGVFQYTG